MLLSRLFEGIPILFPETIPDADVERIEYNSRKTSAGCLFVCLPGAKTDGHRYAAQAYAQGCRLFLVSHPVTLPEDAVIVGVENTRATLAQISAAFYGHPANRLHIIGITGTKGKTSSALMLTAILNNAGKPCAYIGSNGVIIRGRCLETVNTTPESRDLHCYFALMVEQNVEYVVMEVSSQALAHHRVQGVPFEIAVFTNLSPDHIGAADGEHPDFADYMQSKSRLFTEYSVRFAIYNADDPMWENVVGQTTAERISFGVDNAADFTASDVELYRAKTTLGVSFRCGAQGKSYPVILRTPGDFSVHNALCAMAAASVYGVTVESCAHTLQNTSVQGRFELVEGLPERMFVLDYAHNGLSLSSALSVLREYKPGRLICLFGSVGGRTRGRRAELAAAASTLADFCIITSDNPDFEEPEEIIREILSHFHTDCPHVEIPDREKAVRYAVQMSQPGDILLFAGKGHENYQLICGKKIPFSEREIILDACGSIEEKLLESQALH